MDDEFDGERLDQFAVRIAPTLSRVHAQRLIEAGHVTLNGKPSKASRKVHTGEFVRVEIPPATPVSVEPENLPLTVLFEDSDLIVVDKTAGMVVHPAPGHPAGTLVNALLFHCDDLSGIGGELRPGIVHRIDKDTTGVLVATKNDRTHQAMSVLFHDKIPKREYIAVVSPAPTVDSGTIDTWYGRHPRDRKKFSSKVTTGKRAVTHFVVEERFAQAALVRCRLETGRTHQIRVHMADAGYPLIGDAVYGRRYKAELGELSQSLGRQALHAQILAFEHPTTHVTVAFESPLPADLVALVAGLRTLNETPS